MRLQLKILFEIKALPFPEKNWKNLLGGGGGGGVASTPPLAIGGLILPFLDRYFGVFHSDL